MAPRVESGSDGILRISGDLLFSTVVELRSELLSQLEKRGAESVILDLSAVGRVDSAALSLWLCCLRLARRRGGSVTLQNAPEDMRSIADLVGLEAQLS